MGEVWLAEDTRLDRKVAVKVLPAQFASDPERLARFGQEAKAAAALNHPNIAAVFDVGSEGEGTATIHYMVQEYLEGETLRARIDRGALPLEKALALAAEIAEALSAAHQAGIVHRDLKPDNIFVIPGDHAKVLDFGLAKLMEVAPPSASSASMSPTMLGTVAGQVMGTAGYMAPEQVSGAAVDARADLFGFGCVLYEMVTGRRAFQGKNIHETLGRIISDPPEPVATMREDLPLKLGWIIDKLLAKNPARRYQSAAGVNADIQQLRDDLKSGPVLTAGLVAAAQRNPIDTPASRAGLAGRAMAILALAAVAVVAAYAGRYLAPGADPGKTVRARITLAPATMLLIGGVPVHPPFAIDPDGEGFVFAAPVDETDRFGTRLYRRRFEDAEALPIPGTEGARWPFFSPDGSRIGFEVQVDSEADIVSVPAEGGPATTHVELVSPRGLHWGDDGFIYYTTTYRSGIWRVAAEGGDPEQVTQPTDPEVTHRHARLIPGTDTLLYTAADNYQFCGRDARVMALDLTRREAKVVVEGADARALPTGHLLYSDGTWLVAAPFDRSTASITGPSTPMVADVLTSQCGVNPTFSYGMSIVDVSADGTLMYLPGGMPSRAEQDLVLVTTEGEETRLPLPSERFLAPRASWDGSRIVVRAGDLNEILLFDANRPSASVTLGEGAWPSFSRDGEWILYKTAAGLVRRRADATGSAEVLYTNREEYYPRGYTPDGENIVLVLPEATEESSDGWGIYLLDASGAGSPRRLFEGGVQAFPSFSPDGEWMTYVDGVRGERRLIITSFPGLEGRFVVGRGGSALWSRDGATLFYISASFSADVFRVDVSDPRNPGEPELLLDNTGYGGARPVHGWDMLADGRFVFAKTRERAEGSGRIDGTEIEMVLNWFEELKERAPLPTRSRQ
jgi:serine/threonine-protein kinase